MGDAGPNGAPDEIAFEAYGVCLAVGASTPEILDRIRPLLPPGWRPCPRSAVEGGFSIVRDDDRGRYSLFRNGKELAVTKGLELDLVLMLLDTQLRIQLGRTAPDTIFIHAGAVAHNGRMIVIPARSFGGKTTLVAALVKAGAVYYSDEFAVIDRNGLVQHYAKPLSIRLDGLEQTDHAVESFGGVAGEQPLPVGMIVITTYKKGAEWKPKRLTPGAGAMALLANAVPAMERPGEVLPAISRAARDAVVIEGDRGEAEEVAPLLLEALEAQEAQGD